MALEALAFGLAIGVALGMLGGGGSVLAVPILVYVFDLGVHEATTTSLLVVTAAALAGGLMQARGRRVCWAQAAAFAPSAVAGVALGTAANQAADAAVLLYGFAAVMLGAALFTWRKALAADRGAEEADASCPPLAPARTVGAGLVVGLLTGFFGVGGGFLVVPLLALALSFPLRQAIGTSLVIVAAVSLIGLVAHLVAGSALDGETGIAMAAGCTVGAVGGAALGCRVPQRLLGQAFALLVATVASYVVVATALGVGY